MNENKQGVEKLDNLHDRINIHGKVDQWSLYFAERLKKAMTKHRIGVTGALRRSITRQLIRNGGDVTAVLIKFHMYGRFVDMGVGRGLKAYERGMNKQMRRGAWYGGDVSYISRKPKRWYNKVGRAQIYKLREILEKELGHAAVYNVNDALGGGSTEYEVRV